MGELVLLGILSDTHNHLARTRRAVELLEQQGAETLIHCGDLACPEIVEICTALPFYFVLGNHDADMAAALASAAEQYGAHDLGWGGQIMLAQKSIAVTHGHMTADLRPLIAAEPDYLLTGHSHETHDRREGCTRRINPGALFRTPQRTVALLDLETDVLRFLTINDK